ncbi:hypothetical protein A1122_18685 [Yersinia pestis A1122]|uniref:Transposase n=1 Tax=Yersinia pestis TaxID=632 RepID=Q8CKW5_YERPE|nr:hypothetical [Yersinia pestis KIM10+]AEL74354.1 hypothetical protein A1122_18685 [Yersinia pestis A1122]EKS47129.1 hypothetical protein INS_07490 [Yersinia pestis INS]KGA51957.1 putative transposase [Yersinia pestis]
MPLIRKTFKRLHYPVDIIVQCVCWYLADALSLRNLEETMAERGVIVDHSTLHRTAGLYVWFRCWIKPFVDISAPWCADGEWTKPTSKLKTSGNICTAQWTLQARPSISC